MASTSEPMLPTNAADAEQHGTNTQQRASAIVGVTSAADAGQHGANSQERPSAIGEVTLEATEVAWLAGLDVYPGARFFTKGPRPCAVEYDGVPGNRRVALPEASQVVILEALVHVISEKRYVAARIHSTFGSGYGWINLCCESQRFVMPHGFSIRERSRSR